jgi:hypothetical protein
VHTTVLRSEEFALTVDDRPAAIEDLFPGFDEFDRLGIVISADQGAAGAATLILATVTAFYDRMRAAADDFFAYADYFAFHIGRPRGSLRKLDVYPEHKEVVVAPDADAILRAINDRGVTRLLVPDGPPRTPALARETLDSARRRIASAIAYSPTGQTAGADVLVRGSAQSDAFTAAMLAATSNSASTRTDPSASTRADPSARTDAGPPAQSFRRVELAAALGMLAPPPG